MMKDERPTHLDLFSGIGGFALAAQWAGFRTVAFVEWEPYCQKLLKQHWARAEVFGNICEFDGARFRGIDLLTGGFPCQPFSTAGKQRGKDDDRYLWPEMFRVIQESGPAWIVGENVDGLDGLGLDDCISDLESIGYEVAPPLEIPACAVGAQQERNRIWICAHANRDRLEADSNNKLLREPAGYSRNGGHNGAVGVPTMPLWSAQSPPRTSFCGIPDGLPNRPHRIKGLGNAIVPQVAYQIIKEIRKLI